MRNETTHRKVRIPIVGPWSLKLTATDRENHSNRIVECIPGASGLRFPSNESGPDGVGGSAKCVWREYKSRLQSGRK
jgi:hypothetical protein